MQIFNIALQLILLVIFVFSMILLGSIFFDLKKIMWKFPFLLYHYQFPYNSLINKNH